MFLSVVSQKLDSRVMGPNKSPPKDREAGAEIYCPYLRLFFNPPSSANFPLITCLNSFPVRERGCLHKCLLWNGEIITEHPPHPRPFMNLAEMPFKSRSVREEQRSVGSSFQFSHCPLCWVQLLIRRVMWPLFHWVLWVAAGFMDFSTNFQLFNGVQA